MSDHLDALERNHLIQQGVDQEGMPNYRCFGCGRTCINPEDHAPLCSVKARLRSAAARS